MSLTDFHSKYFAHELTKRSASDSVERLAVAVAGAQVDLNPHQVDAALFAFKSPFSKGALLADEVGLGKTIEAGLVLSQYWAERKRRILVITPSNLRKQWLQELSEKFFLPCIICESKNYNALVKNNIVRPMEQDNVVIICSYHFAKNKADDVRDIPWDLVVIDEAHRLRNVYKPANVIANTIKNALANRPKLLLTATPLQNSLLELFGLTCFIDEQVFGDLKSFRDQFANLNDEQSFRRLKERIRPICHRTLRRQVTAYVRFTNRLPILEEFTPEDDEDRLYDLVSDYLQRENLQALPTGQRSLLTLILRKLLASSTFAIAGALNTMAKRLRAKLDHTEPDTPLDAELGGDYEAYSDSVEEWGDGENDEALTRGERAAIESEIKELEHFAQLASSIVTNGKGTALLKVLDIAFQKARTLGAAEKAIIFTESRRTQNYLVKILAASSHKDGIVLFNGSNDDNRSKAIYAQWVTQHKGSTRLTGSPTADMRSALVDYFRNQGRIMIATEAGAEGVNLQFCSLIINYDLPWNPQRIEQRIGRCHRYGQQHDVVVVNFLNRKNEADKRVYQLLEQKFKLFEGVFGASDEILGAIESGVDFEKRIANIYQQCRQPEAIREAFDQLQRELDQQIHDEMSLTYQKLLENFDDEVREKLRVSDERSKECLDQFDQWLMQLTRHELGIHANFQSHATFQLLTNPFPDEIPLGMYELPRVKGGALLYRLEHPLAMQVLAQAQKRVLPPLEVIFDYSSYEGKVSTLEARLGVSGWLMLSQVTVSSLNQIEDRLIFATVTDEGDRLDDDFSRRLFNLPGKVGHPDQPNGNIEQSLLELTDRQLKAIQQDIEVRNADFFEEEAVKLDRWADDLKEGLEQDIKELDRQIKGARRAATAATSLEEKLLGQKEVKSLEAMRKQKRQSLFATQDAVDARREQLIEDIQSRLQQDCKLETIFIMKWSVQ